MQKDNYENPELQEGTSKQSLLDGWMIQSQDPDDIVSGIWGDQNVRNREDSNHSQRDSRKPHHGTTFIASASAPVKKQGGSLLEQVLIH